MQSNSDLQYQDANELYQFDKVLGEGTFGSVQKAVFKPTGEEIAVKILKQERATDRVINLFRQEAELLNSFNHENIIKIEHLILLQNQFYLGMELIDNGTLKELMDKKFSGQIGQNRFTDEEASKILKCIL